MRTREEVNAWRRAYRARKRREAGSLTMQEIHERAEQRRAEKDAERALRIAAKPTRSLQELQEAKRRYAREWYQRRKKQHQDEMRAYYWQHRDERLAWARSQRGKEAKKTAHEKRKPHLLVIGGTKIDVRKLPAEYRQIGELIIQTKREMGKRQ